MAAVARSTKTIATENGRKTDAGSDDNAGLDGSTKRCEEIDEGGEDFENVTYSQIKNLKRRKAITYKYFQDLL